MFLKVSWTSELISWSSVKYFFLNHKNVAITLWQFLIKFYEPEQDNHKA